MIAKDFQEATANRIVELFESGHKRVLLADEVGLGKTIVAKTVVEKTGVWRKENNKPDYVVVYICSNAGIANQNCGKLGIEKQYRVSISEGRLSMQHIMLEESMQNGNVRLIPMTPATSFQMKSGAGIALERALAFCLMDECRMIGSYAEEFSLLMRTRYIADKQSWDWYVSRQRDRIYQLNNKKQYLADMKECLQKTYKEDLIHEVKSACRKIRKNIHLCKADGKMDQIIPWQQQKNLINRIRYWFAEISLGMLNPDLVIMDEFQRFKDLIEVDENDYSDSAMLSKKFLRDNTESCVLLLSATPYKPYSTLSEITEGEESHLQGFMRVMDFLANGAEENKQFHTVWENYSEHLAEIKGKDLSVLVSSKKDAESELYKRMCRTERRDAAIINTDKAKAMPMDCLASENISTYIAMQNLMQELGIGNFPIDYVKSASFLMSFMNYKVKDKIDDALIDNKKNTMLQEEKMKLFKGVAGTFIKRSQINGYQKLPDSNARLHILFDEVFERIKDTKSAPELLLWIPTANPYYVCDKNNIFEQSKGYTKTLVFSSWEMVPRVIATLTSYEAERLVNGRIGNKRAEQQSYYALPEDADYEDGDSPRKSKRGKTRFLTREQRELFVYPSIWLAKQYDYKEYFGWNIKDIKKEIKKKIKKELYAITDKYSIEKGKVGAKQLLVLLKLMDAIALRLEIEEIPERVPDNGQLEVLVNMAIGSPAICLYRSLGEIENFKERQKIASECCDASFVSMFNRPESRSIMDAVFEGKRGSSDENHYEQAFHYCVDGNFQAMLDEYKFALGFTGMEFAEAVNSSFLQTSNLPYVSQEYYKSLLLNHPQSKIPRLRVHFAAGYFDAKTSDKTIQRVNNVRNAFNSPFRPFVLATTSVGQEGLDFHLYSRKIVHWNLPSNPIDLEQREGRINRFLCHAIRQNVAENEAASDWDEKFVVTREKYGADASEMIPFWCLPEDYPYKYQIERIVPMYPFSQDKLKYDRLINVLALYRLTLGQPRQEEMIAILQREDLSVEQMEELFFDLSPFSRNKKAK